MKGLEIWILSYLLNSLWQAPLLFATGWLVARMLQSAGSAVEHRVWVVVLLLQSLLPAACLMPWEWLQRFSFWGGHAGRPGEAQVSIVMGAGTGFGEFYVPGALLTAIAIVYAAISLYFAARFVWRSLAISDMRRDAGPAVLSGEAAAFWARCSRIFAIDTVAIAASSRVAGPITMGVRRKLVLLPLGMAETLPEEDLKTVIAHEFSHMQRQDFFKNLLYELLSLPVAYHPLLWLTRARVMQSREMICDEMAAELNGQQHYARSLLRLARLLVEGTATPHAIGIFDANTFERRIMNLTQKQTQVRGLARAAMVAAGALLGIAISASAVAVAAHVNPVGAGDSQAHPPKQLTVSAEIMSHNLITKTIPVYPQAAKKAGIQGTVVLEAIISGEGNVESLRVVSGPQDLQQAALDAVREWKYKPYLLNGDPIEVSTTINIIFSLKG
jgi:bla regulator protein blaR1